MIKTGIKAYQFAKTYKNYKNSSNDFERIKFAKMLNRLFQEQGGIFLKFAQYLGTDPEQAKEIQDLTFSLDQTLDLADIKKIIKNYFHQNWDQIFSEIDSHAHCASISQVHRSTLLSGEIVALKIQYPNIRQQINEQMSLLNLLPTSKPEKKWGVDVNAFKKMINDLIDKELDFRVEAETQMKAYNIYKNYGFIKVPRIYPEYSNEKIITSEYIEGLSVEEVVKVPISDRVTYAKNILKTYLVMLKEGLFQGDSNHGNFLFIQNTKSIALLDYGQMVILDREMHNATIALIYQLILNHKINFGDFFVTLGFNEDKLMNIHDSLGIIAQIIFEPFLNDSPFDLKKWNYKEKLDLVLGENKWWFRSAGGVDFFLVMKSFMGIKNLIKKLGFNINWQESFKEVFSGSFDEFENYVPTLKATKSWAPLQMSQKVKVQIEENGVNKVQLILPFNILYNIEDALDTEILHKLQETKIDVHALALKALTSSLRAQVLFELIEDHKTIRVEII